MRAACSTSRQSSTARFSSSTAKTGRIVDTIDHEGSGHWLAVLPDGSKAYVANKDDKLLVTVLDLKTRKQVGSVPMPRGTQGITASPDGKRVIAMDLARPEIAVIDTATDAVLDRIALAEHDGRRPTRRTTRPTGNGY